MYIVVIASNYAVSDTLIKMWGYCKSAHTLSKAVFSETFRNLDSTYGLLIYAYAL